MKRTFAAALYWLAAITIALVVERLEDRHAHRSAPGCDPVPGVGSLVYSTFEGPHFRLTLV